MLALVDLAAQFQSIKKDVLTQLESFIDNGTYIMGQRVSLLEQQIAEKLGVSYAVGVANGTDALILTLDAFGIGEGDEVITTPYTFFATAEAISRRGAIPIFVDVDPVTFNLDPSQIESVITPRTKAIMPVHLFGHPADMDPINRLAQKYGLIVVEDACQAFGARYQDKLVGGFGHAACFSFFPTKNLGTMGDGGIVVTSDPAIASKIRKLRHHGSNAKYYHDELGYNSRLDELHAMILLIALSRIDEWNERRREIAGRYQEQLGHLSYLNLPEDAQDAQSVYHLYCIGSDERDGIVSWLRGSGVQTGIYYPCPLHLQMAYKHLGYEPGDFPVAERLSETLFAIPMHPFLSESDQDTICSQLIKYGSQR